MSLMPRCRTCLQEKAEDQFFRTPSGNPRRTCKTCMNDRQKARQRARREADPEGWSASRRYIIIKSKYGIDRDDYERLLTLQGGVCAICQNPARGRWLAVDHCHDTGKVRGLLCSPCNSGMGYLGDDIQRLRAAADYLEERA